jgi:DNA-binding SARP family transcriptional activator
MISGAPRQADLASAPWDLERLEMLPGWYDDWIVPERERLRQRILHGLDAFAGRLIVAERCAEAVEVALVAVNADPLRETAVRVLVAAHLAEGNRGEAARRFAAHRTLMLAELGVEPSPQFAAMLIAADAHASHREPL